MSQLGERIGRRLAKRHGLVFQDDPCNFYVHSDKEGVMRNVLGGQGVMQWTLNVNCRWHNELPKIKWGDGFQTAEIGSDFGATTCLKWKFWKVSLYCMSGETPILWIDQDKTADRTDLEER